MKRYLVLTGVAVALGAYSSEVEIGRSGRAHALGPLGHECSATGGLAGSPAANAARDGCRAPGMDVEPPGPGVRAR